MFPKPCIATNSCAFIMANRKKCFILIGKIYHLHLYISASNDSNWSVSFCPKSQKIDSNTNTHSTKITTVTASTLQLSFFGPNKGKISRNWIYVSIKLLNYLMLKNQQNTHGQKRPRKVCRNHKFKDFVKLHHESI